MKDRFDTDYESPETERKSRSTISALWNEKSDTDEEEFLNNSAGGGNDVGPKKSLKAFLISVIIILSVLVVALVSYIIYSLKGDILSLNGASNNSNSTTSEHVDEFGGESAIKFESKPQNTDEYTAESIYEVLAPSVVGVVVYDSNSDIISDPKSEGSGMVINERGYIVTNSHVVGNSKQGNIKIVFSDGEEVPGKVIGYDSKTDIAVIKAEKTGLKAVTFGNSDEAKVGSSVLALGNPLGLDFAGSLTKGIISAVNRSSNGSPKSLVKYIQTDTAINPGNSGGPLINMYGQVIGVTTAKIALPHCEGMGLAIPSNTVKSIVDDIIAKGYVTGRVRLGLSGRMVTNYQAQRYNVPMGILVSEISADSNLKQAGIQVGDIITKIESTDIKDFDAFYAELETHSPGNTVKLTVYRSSANRMSSDTFETDVVLLEDKGETQESSPRSTFE